MPFRQAHHVTGELVARLENEHTDLGSASDELLSSIHAELTGEVRELADPRRSLAARATPGGTAPARVTEQLAELRARARSL
jgi:argininosuccinate lyase